MHMSLPPALALGTFFEGVMQSALRQFFSRATLEIEPASTPTSSLDQPLTIEPSPDPATLIICWTGTRYKLHASGRWSFTPHEVRVARAIGAVISARYRAILNPQLAAERGELFRGQIEDRYVGAFLDERPYARDLDDHRGDRIASVIELLRLAIPARKYVQGHLDDIAAAIVYAKAHRNEIKPLKRLEVAGRSKYDPAYLTAL